MAGSWVPSPNGGYVSKEAERRSPSIGVALFVASVSALCVALLFATELHTHEVTVHTVASASEPAVVSADALFVSRCAMIVANMYALAAKLRRVDHKVVRFDRGSQLKEKEFVVSGADQASYFTVQCWILQLAYLVGAAACSVLSLNDVELNGVALRRVLPAVTWFAFEVSFSCALLVSAVVTFVLIPTELRAGRVPVNFFWMEDQACTRRKRRTQ